jgi:Ribbon-helix-helix protein, copG family
MVSTRTELRVELPAEEVAVLDGHCQATGRDRTHVVRQILREWSDAELHRAIVICRVAGRHPADPEPNRSGGR